MKGKLCKSRRSNVRRRTTMMNCSNLYCEGHEKIPIRAYVSLEGPPQVVLEWRPSRNFCSIVGMNFSFVVVQELHETKMHLTYAYPGAKMEMQPK